MVVVSLKTFNIIIHTQYIELPAIPLKVSHFHLYKGRCCSCGREEKGYVPSEYQVGYGPRLSALMIELAGIAGNSRRMIQGFCHSVLGLPISLGAIQKVIDRASEAILPHYEAIRDKARSSKVNHIDETPWYNSGWFTLAVGYGQSCDSFFYGSWKACNDPYKSRPKFALFKTPYPSPVYLCVARTKRCGLLAFAPDLDNRLWA